MKKYSHVDPQALLKLLRQSPHPLRLDDVLRRANLSRRVKKDVQDALYALAANGSLVKLKGGAWAAGENLKTMTGKLAVQRSGAAFVVPEGSGGKGDVYIPPGALGEAWNGDLVEILVLPAQPGRSPEGRIIRIAKRGDLDLTVRVLHEEARRGAKREAGRVMTRPADSRLDFDVLVDVSGLDAPPVAGELLRVKIEEEKGKLDSPFDNPLWPAVAVSSLGREDAVTVQETLTKLNHLIPMEFPDDVLAEAEQASRRTPALEAGVEDVRDLPLVTIDGADARDFDDAVYVEEKGKGWRLVVAIADVSHYVRPRTGLDREARERGNSYYFPASVEPMLPESLSNGICSLRPDEDRRVMVADMHLDGQGNPEGSRFYAGLMRSRARLTYEQVQSCLDQQKRGGDDAVPGAEPGVAKALWPMLGRAAVLAALLMERRKRRGGLDFDMPEAEFVVKDGLVSDIRNRERLFSHRLIEAFMVEANEAVAEYLTRKRQPLLYRVHPAPSPEKLETLARSLGEMGLDLPLPPPKKAGDPAWLPGLLRAAGGTEQAWLVDSLALRAMMQARYDPEEDIHFGLASQCYCHFTSPIRRYPDLVNHRALKTALGLDPGGKIPTGKKLVAVADTCNARERAAQEAEREITRRLGCLLLQDRTGEKFAGVISGVMHFGLFVQLAGMPMEGMIRVENLGDEYFLFDESRNEMKGQRSGVSYRLGDSLEVRLTDVNVGRLEINLALAEGGGGGNRRGKRPLPDTRKSGARAGKAKPKTTNHKKPSSGGKASRAPQGRTYGKRRGR